MNQDLVPKTLRERNQWVLWKMVLRDGKWTKVPFQADGSPAKSTDATTWTAFNKAVAAYGHGTKQFTGIGFVFAPDDGICGIDLDACRNKETGEWAAWAREWVLAFDSYAEMSPSETGVKIFIKGTKPTWCGANVKIAAEKMPGDKEPGVEVYDRGRYFAVTGKRLQGMPDELQERQAVLDRFCETFFKKVEVDFVPTYQDFGSDEAIMERCRKYMARLEPAIEGQNGSGRTYHAACIAAEAFGLSEEQCMVVMAEWNLSHCTPLWSEKDLIHKVKSAIKNRKDVGYLRDALPRNWNRVPQRTYEEPKAKTKIRGRRNIIRVSEAIDLHIDRVVRGEENLHEIGIAPLDRAIGGGVAKPEIIVFAAPSGQGKSAFMLQMAHQWSRKEKKCLVISAEMSAALLGKRTLQTMTNLPMGEWKDNPAELRGAKELYLEHREDWFIDDDVGNIDEVLQSIDQTVDEHGVELVCVDYIQLLDATERCHSTYEKVSKISDLLRAYPRTPATLSVTMVN